MKSLLYFITLFFLSYSLQAGWEGELTMSPEKPEASSTIELSYKPGDIFKNNTKPLYAFVYYFSEQEAYPTAVSYELKKSKSKYTGEINNIPSTAVFALIKIGDARTFDWNKESMWDFMVYDGKKPKRSAYMRNALSYLGNVVPNLKRPTDLEKGKQLIRKEIESYPDNVQAKIGLASLLLDTKELEKTDYTARIEGIIANGYDKNKESEVRAVSRALRSIGKPVDGDEAEAAYIKKNPKSDLAEEAARMKCYQSQTREEFETNVKDYITKFRLSVFSDRMYMDLINSYLQQGNGNEAIRLIRAYPVPPGVNSNPPASLLNMMAVTLLQQDSLLSLARQYAERAIRTAENVDSETRPRFVAKEEYDYSNTEVYGICHDTYGYILRKMNKLSEAIEAFAKCEEILGEAASGDMLEHFAEALTADGKKDSALAVMRRAIRTARALSPTTQRFLSMANNGDMTKSQEEFKSLTKEARDAKRSKLRTEMMNYDIQKASFSRNDGTTVRINDFKLMSMDGKEVRLEDLKGKVVVLDFWATWCGPCRVSMPYMQKVYEKYKDEDDVVIALVNVWERTQDSTDAQRVQSRKKIVQTFLSQNKDFSFPMYMDTQDAIVGCFGVTGIPTKFYIDRNGIVQFKEVGFPGADVFVDETSDRIDLLLNNK